VNAGSGRLRIAATKVLVLIIVAGLVAAFCPTPADGASGHKCSNPACDINAIGRRKFFSGQGVGNWYSTEKEKELGEKYSTAVEQTVDIVKDAGVNDYVDQVAQRIARNSDADMPITVRIIRRDAPGAFTLYGGHLYLTTGLLLKLHSEGELASVLARGIAHAAVRSVARLQTRTTLMEIASVHGNIGVFAIDTVPHAHANNDITLQTFGFKLQHDFELEADYFGIQYIYKSGYDTDCFLSVVQSLWQRDRHNALANAFDPFPPVADRLKRLHQEIDDILPKQAGAVVSTPEFDRFMAGLRDLESSEPAPEKDAQPKLIRHDLVSR